MPHTKARLSKATEWNNAHRPTGGRWGTCGYGWWGGGNLGVKLLVPVAGAAVAEGPHALPALCDVEGASRTGVRHGDLPEAVLAAATLELLLVMTLWRRKTIMCNVNY